jgi:alkylation response protein AidB-like acyl-CoA dehydrogenase
MISVVALQAELARRQGQLGSLIKEHADVSSRLDAVRAEIEALGGTVNGTASRGRRGGTRRGRSASGARGRRPQNAASLADSLVKVLQGKEMSVPDVVEAVQKAGYRSSSKNFRVIVNQHLLKSPFKRVGRGVYTVK